MQISRKSVFALVFQFLLISQLSATEKSCKQKAHHAGGQKAHLEGYVQDENGKPVKGVLISVDQGSYTTQGETAVIPLIFSKAAGVIVIDDPDMINVHSINSHFTKTDSKGHYLFKKLPAGQYSFSARGQKKYFGDFKTSERGLVPNKKLLANYSFPDTEQVVLQGGQTSIKNVILHNKH